MSRVLFVCLQNAGRSQISQAIFERKAADGRHRSRSAGTTPAGAIHPEVIEVLGEIGVDLAGKRPAGLTRDLVEWADVVVTMGCGDACPWLPATRRVDWDLPDPKSLPDDEFRAVRDEIERRVQRLLAELDKPS